MKQGCAVVLSLKYGKYRGGTIKDHFLLIFGVRSTQPQKLNCKKTN